MLLTEFFSQPEGESSAKSKTTTPTAEAKRTKNTNCNMVAESTSKVKDLLREIEQLKKLITNPRGRGVASMRKHLDQLYKDLEQACKVTEVSDNTLKNYKSLSAGDVVNRQNIANRSGQKDFKIAKRNAGQERAEKKLQGMTEDTDSIDKITVDVPLMIRLLEYAREDAKTDMDLHNVAEQLIALSQTGRTLSMQEYDTIVSSTNN